jgi:hypothetical protein
LDLVEGYFAFLLYCTIQNTGGDAMKPTQETYSALQAAYEHFNRELFGGALPE